MIVTQVQYLQSLEVVVSQGRNDSDIVVLQVYLGQTLQVPQLLESHVVVAQIDGGQILKITQILFNDLHNILTIKLTLNSFVR